MNVGLIPNLPGLACPQLQCLQPLLLPTWGPVVHGAYGFLVAYGCLLQEAFLPTLCKGQGQCSVHMPSTGCNQATGLPSVVLVRVSRSTLEPETPEGQG